METYEILIDFENPDDECAYWNWLVAMEEDKVATFNKTWAHVPLEDIDYVVVESGYVLRLWGREGFDPKDIVAIGYRRLGRLPVEIMNKHSVCFRGGDYFEYLTRMTEAEFCNIDAFRDTYEIKIFEVGGEKIAMFILDCESG